MQVVVAHGDVVLSPGGKAAFRQGSVAFFQEVADRRRQQEAGGAGPSRATLLAVAGATSAAALAVAFVWRRHQSR